MKTLKLCRLMFITATFAFMLIAFLPKALEEMYDWTMIAVLVAFIVLAPISLSYYMKKEIDAKYLANAENGYMIMNMGLFGIVALAGIIGTFVNIFKPDGSPWISLAWTSVGLYQIFNTAIIYKAKKAAEPEDIKFSH